MKNYLVDIRNSLHSCPELGFCEYKTSEIIKSELDKLGIEYTVSAKTGVVATIYGKNSGKTILFRSDIDGLPIEDKSNNPIKAENMMHACGHDVHTACLLGAARLFVENRDKLEGNVKLCFQPAEETDGGALPMINEGILENPKVDAAVALHVEPLEEVGRIQVKNGAIMASPDDFRLTVKGVGGHGAYPEKCIDPIACAAEIITAYKGLLKTVNNAVVSVCSVHAGSCTNAIPETVEIAGTARSLDVKTRAFLESELEKIATEICKSHGASCEFEFIKLFPPLINDEAMNNVVKSAAKSLKIGISELDAASMAGDDFAYFAQKIPSSYYRLGVGNKAKGICYPIHNPKFDIDEDSLEIGARLTYQIALEYLG